jgi:hypothetical protein
MVKTLAQLESGRNLLGLNQSCARTSAGVKCPCRLISLPAVAHGFHLPRTNKPGVSLGSKAAIDNKRAAGCKTGVATRQE